MAPTSNLHTLGIEPEQHPLGLLYRSGFNVTLNTDNRLMSSVTLTDEFALASEVHALSINDLRRITMNAADAAFIDGARRKELHDLIDTGYPS